MASHGKSGFQVNNSFMLFSTAQLIRAMLQLVLLILRIKVLNWKPAQAECGMQSMVLADIGVQALNCQLCPCRSSGLAPPRPTHQTPVSDPSASSPRARTRHIDTLENTSALSRAVIVILFNLVHDACCRLVGKLKVRTDVISCWEAEAVTHKPADILMVSSSSTPHSTFVDMWYWARS